MQLWPSTSATKAPPVQSKPRLVGALTEHYGLTDWLADYRRQFEKMTRHEGEDPIFE